jgi:hypothetical protein
MFQNSFQNGNYFELFDPKSTFFLQSASQDKQKNLYKLVNISNLNNKVFDKDLKSICVDNLSVRSVVHHAQWQDRVPEIREKGPVLNPAIPRLPNPFPPRVTVEHGTGHLRSQQSILSYNTQTKRRIMISSTNNKL